VGIVERTGVDEICIHGSGGRNWREETTWRKST